MTTFNIHFSQLIQPDGLFPEKKLCYIPSPIVASIIYSPESVGVVENSVDLDIVTIHQLHRARTFAFSCNLPIFAPRRDSSGFLVSTPRVFPSTGHTNNVKVSSTSFHPRSSLYYSSFIPSHFVSRLGEHQQSSHCRNATGLSMSILQPPPPKMHSPSAAVVFSDVDGTLVHYPKHFSEYADIVSTNEDEGTAVIRYKETEDERECLAMVSKTGGTSYISKRTLDLVAQLRRLDVTFVIITGARASTYEKRRPRLPVADFEFYENGGRKLRNGKLDPEWSDAFVDIVGHIPDREAISPIMPPYSERKGILWRLYEKLLSDGWNIDANDYTTNIRVDVARSEGKTPEDFASLIESHVKPNNLSSSFNLGKADIYPAASGKASAARHVLDIVGVDKRDAVALFDDDNDIELGNLCGASFLPSVTHDRVYNAVKSNPHWTLMERPGILGVEDALQRVIELRENFLSANKALSEDKLVAQRARK